MSERTSLMERDIGPHEHQMVIYLSYEIYAVCQKCGMHDWTYESEDEYLAKYPTARTVDFLGAYDDMGEDPDDTARPKVPA